MNNKIWKRPPPIEACDRREHLLYLVTIKCNSVRYTEKADLEKVYHQVVGLWKRVEWASKVCWELDQLNRLHLHTYCTAQKAPYFKLATVKGYSVHFQPVPMSDMDRVVAYINKQSQHPAAIQMRENISYFTHNYAFSD